MLEWDEEKRRINLTKHGIDFADCVSLFDEPMITKEDSRQSYGECRLQSLALLNGGVVFAVWVETLEGVRLISVREATKPEKRYYYANIEI